MTTAMPTLTGQSRMRLLPIAAGASVVHLLMMIPGYHDNGEFQTGAWLAVLGFSLLVSVGLFLFVVPGRGAVTAAVLGVLALLSAVVFWAGLTMPLAAAAGATGWTAFQERRSGPAVAGLALAALSVVALVAIIIGDATR